MVKTKIKINKTTLESLKVYLDSSLWAPARTKLGDKLHVYVLLVPTCSNNKC